MQLNDSTFFIVHSWMVNKLNLKTTERDVFAILYGFGQDGESDFHGSLSYIATLTGYSRNSICTALKNLTDKKLINKKEHTFNNIKYCSYTINFDTVQATCTPIQAPCTPVQAPLTNNINNKIVNNVYKSKDLYTSDRGKKSNLYSNCISLIDNFIMKHIPVNANRTDIRKLLIQHLNIALEQKRIRGKLQYKGILDKLYKIQQDTNTGYENIIFYSIEKGYPTFYEPPKRRSNNAIATESGRRHVESFTEEDKEEQDKFIKQLKKEGKKYVF